MELLMYFLLAVFIPVLVQYASGGWFINLAYYAAPQVLWWLFCVVWWACWKTPKNHGLFFGGIAAADWLLLYIAFPRLMMRDFHFGENSNRWFAWMIYSPVVLVLGGLAGGIAGAISRRLSQKAQPGISLNSESGRG